MFYAAIRVAATANNRLERYGWGWNVWRGWMGRTTSSCRLHGRAERVRWGNERRSRYDTPESILARLTAAVQLKCALTLIRMC